MTLPIASTGTASSIAAEEAALDAAPINAPELYGRINNQIWLLIAVMASLATLSFIILGMTIYILSNPTLLAVAASYAVVTAASCWIRRDARLSRVLVLMGQGFVISFLGFLITYAAYAVSFPYRDAELYAIDLWLGFDRAAAHRSLEASPALFRAFSTAYYSIGWQSLILPPVLIACGWVSQAQRYILAFGTSLIMTSFIASFVPAKSAFIHVDLPDRGLTEPPDGMYEFFTVLDALHNGSLRNLSFQDLDGIITFPSFHTTCAVLFVWAAWKMPLGRWVFLLLNLLMLLSIPTEGGHYLVDVVAGLLVAAVTITFVDRVTTTPPSPRRLDNALTTSD